MPKVSLQIQSDLVADLIYIAKWPDVGNLQYFQSIRSGAIREDSAMAQNYRAMEFKFVLELEKLVQEESPFDAIIMPPSSRSDARPYHEALTNHATMDISPRLSRSPGVFSGKETTTAADLSHAIKYQPSGDETSIRSLLIVDESIASGKTVEIIVGKLREAGLPSDCRTVIAVAAWLHP